MVVGAGTVGLSIALHLQMRGRSVVLVDRGPPGHGTSFGNAGIIERASVVPYAFPRDPATILRLALNRGSDVRYERRWLPRVLPWLARYWWHSAPSRLAEAAGKVATALVRPAGLVNVFREEGEIDPEGLPTRSGRPA